MCRKTRRFASPDSKTSSTPSSARRLIVTGGALAGAGLLLPERWTRPVVQSVLLPAHAQTTPGTGQPCPPVVIAGRQLSCDTQVAEFLVATFSFDGECLSVATEVLFEGPPLPQPDQIRIQYSAATPDELFIQLNSATDIRASEVVECGQGAPSTTGAQLLPGITVNGTDFEASFTFSGDMTTLAHGDIVLQPV